jgi:hypothetical protein
MAKYYSTINAANQAEIVKVDRFSTCSLTFVIPQMSKPFSFCPLLRFPGK